MYTTEKLQNEPEPNFTNKRLIDGNADLSRICSASLTTYCVAKEINYGYTIYRSI